MDRNSSLALHLKYRPQNLDEFVGNVSVVESLRTILAREKGNVRSFLFTGPSGTGKTTLARIIAKELNCSDQDFKEFNSANVRGIDTIRDIANNCQYSPVVGKVKIFLLDESHKLTNDAQNALLKLLEDTPSHVVIILSTTDPEKLLDTIKTRCSTFSLSTLKRQQVKKLLDWVCSEEQVDIPEKILEKIIDCCEGSPRQALVLLDQIIDITDDDLALETIINSSVNETTVLELCQKLLQNASWATVAKIINGIDDEPEKVRLAVLGYMTKVLLSSKPNLRASQIGMMFMDNWFSCGKFGLVQACYLLCEKEK